MTRDKQKAKRAAMLEVLRTDAVNALETYEAWAPGAHASGRFTPVQFFAVVLWEAGSRLELTEDDELRIVSDWWSALERITVKRVALLGRHGPYRGVYPLDAVTLLELRDSAVSGPRGWCMACDELDCWLASIGRGELCAWFFRSCGLGGQVMDISPGQSAEPAPGNSTATDARRVRIPDTKWTNEQEDLLEQDFKDAKGKNAAVKHMAVAELWGIKSGSVKKQLKAIKAKRESAGSIGQMSAQLTGTK